MSTGDSITARGRDLFVELIYTPDERVDLPEGGWSQVPQKPSGVGWFLWDLNPDRKTGWLRVWARNGRVLALHLEVGCA